MLQGWVGRVPARACRACPAHGARRRPLRFRADLVLTLALLAAAPTRGAQAATQRDGDASSASQPARLRVSQAASASREGVAEAEEAGDLQWPTPVRVSVEYPEGGRGDAQVLLELVVEDDGQVSEAEVVTGSPPFAQRAQEAAREWTFGPASAGGTPVAVRLRYLVRFIAQSEHEEAPTTAPAEGAAAPAGEPPAQQSAIVEIMVEGQRPNPPSHSIGHAEAERMPGAFGDPFRAIEVFPGVTPTASGLPFFFIRGAPPGNQGYYVDGIRVPVLYHMVLGPGVIHPALIERVDLYAGGYPARYGRFAGGIVAAESRDAKPEWHGQASIRAVDAGGFLAGPYGGGSLAVGGRYSYTALILSLLVPDLELEYWDYQLRASRAIGEGSSLTAFAFGSFDALRSDESEETAVRNSTEFHRIDLRYDQEVARDTALELAATYGYDRSRGTADEFTLTDHMVSVRGMLHHRVSRAALARAGVDAQLDDYAVLAHYDGEHDADPQRILQARRDSAYGAWADVVLEPSSRLTVVPGLRVDVFRSGNTSAVGVDPRVAATFAISDGWRLKHAFGVVHQPPSFFVGIPGVAIDALAGGLQRSVQSSAGTEHDLPEGFQLSLTGFQHAYFNTTDQASLVSIYPGAEPESRSQGQAVGMEVLLRRKLTRRIGGFAAYTLSRSWRSYDRSRSVSAFDRTHVLQLASAYELGRGWRAGSRFVVYTGVPAAPRDDTLNLVSGIRGSMPRTPTFWRFDARLQKRWSMGSAGEYAALTFEVLNATLNEEIVRRECNAFECEDWELGPVTLPSVGFEVGF